MQKITLVIKLNCIWLFIFWLATGFTDLGAQSQNPFEIKSREFIDTSSQPGNTSELNIQVPEESSTPPSTSNDEFTPGIPFSDSLAVGQNVDSMEVIIGTQRTPAPPSISEKNNRPVPPGEISSDVDIQDTSWWFYIFDLILLLILLGAFIYDKKVFPPLRKAFVHENFLRFLYRDTYLRKPGLFIYLNILFLLGLGFIIFRAAQNYGKASTFYEYLTIQGVVVLLFVIKHVVLHLTSRLVDKPFEVKFYQYWMILSGGLIGLWMIPLVLMISVLPIKYLFIALIICFICIASLLLYRQFKAMLHAKFFLSKHLFQYILYFCAVEIVPAVLLADILVHY